MGIVGVVIFVAAMVGFFVMLLRAWRRGFAVEREAILLGFGGTVVGVLVSGIGDHYWFNLTYPHMTVLFWLYLGMATATILIEEDNSTTNGT
jgi:uncharacterized YccA/Bax inhibitor family protein